ncbi:MAG: hypothetical protein H6729_10655 [Deltaproteobacteria bacterium]|nr:hypothetical protein [Deltaproteobacteria bacterium]
MTESEIVVPESSEAPAQLFIDIVAWSKRFAITGVATIGYIVSWYLWTKTIYAILSPTAVAFGLEATAFNLEKTQANIPLTETGDLRVALWLLALPAMARWVDSGPRSSSTMRSLMAGIVAAILVGWFLSGNVNPIPTFAFLTIGVIAALQTPSRLLRYLVTPLAVAIFLRIHGSADAPLEILGEEAKGPIVFRLFAESLFALRSMIIVVISVAMVRLVDRVSQPQST